LFSPAAPVDTAECTENLEPQKTLNYKAHEGALKEKLQLRNFMGQCDFQPTGERLVSTNVKIPTLSHKAREGWGTLVNQNGRSDECLEPCGCF
jgi:hypothetical protein